MGDFQDKDIALEATPEGDVILKVGGEPIETTSVPINTLLLLALKVFFGIMIFC